MGIFLVLKNNTRRNFRKRSTYVLFFVIPIVILAFGMLTERVKQRTYVIGVLAGEVPERSWEQGIEVISVEEKSANTEVIMGNCDVLVTEDKLQEEIEKHVERGKSVIGLKSEMDQTRELLKQMISMVCTIYFVFSTMYASKVIRDKKEGGMARFEYAGGKRIEYHIGNLLSTFGVVLFQVSMVLVILWGVYGKNVFPVRSAVMLSVCISGVSAVIGSAIAGIAKSELGANIGASIFTILCSVFGGTFVAVEQMPGILAVIGRGSPIYWIVSMFL